jgi:hypothetical protein
MDHRINQAAKERESVAATLTRRPEQPSAQCSAGLSMPKDSGPPVTDQVLAILDSAIGRVVQVTGLADNIGEQLLGEEFSAESSNRPPAPPAPSGRVLNTLYKLETLHDALTRLEGCVNRLTRV